MKTLSALVARQRRAQESSQMRDALRPKHSNNVGSELEFLYNNSFFRSLLARISHGKIEKGCHFMA